MNDETNCSKNHVGNFKTPFVGMTFETVEEARSYGRQNDFRFELELHLRLNGFWIKHLVGY